MAFALADRQRRGVELVLLGLLSAWALYHIAHLLAFPYGRDQGIYAVVAHTWADGGVPYRDAWDFKPPGIFLVYRVARGLFGDATYSIRILEALSLLSMVGAFCVFSARHLGTWRAGLVGGALAIVTYVQLEFWHTAQPESFGATLVAWALVLATVESTSVRRQWVAWLGAGALYGAAALLKPPLGGGLLVSGFVLCRARWRAPATAGRLRAVGAPVLALGLGFALPFATTVAYFAIVGGLDALYETLFVFAPGYARLHFHDAGLIELYARAWAEWAVSFSAFHGVGLALVLALAPIARRERSGLWQLVGVVAIELFGVALQGKLFVYHFGGALPLGGLLAGWGLYKLWLRWRGHALLVIAFAALVVGLFAVRTATRDFPMSFATRCQLRLTAWADPALRDEINDALYTVYDVDAHDIRLVSEWLRTNTPADEPLFVWGFQPAIYELAERRPASRYIYDLAQRVQWGQADARSRLMDDLRATRPAAIVVERGDTLAGFTGNQDDSERALATFPELLDFLRSSYRPGVRLTRYDVFVRR